MTLTEIIKRRTTLLAERQKRSEAHKTWITGCDAELKQLAESERLVAAGVDLSRINHGLHVVSVTGLSKQVVHGAYSDQNRSGQRASVIADAKDDLARGAPRLRREYFGVKNYAHFGDQREDHTYGFGPKHGSIVFSVGLTSAARKMIESGEALTPEQIEDALYVLANLDQIEAAKASQTAA